MLARTLFLFIVMMFFPLVCDAQIDKKFNPSTNYWTFSSFVPVENSTRMFNATKYDIVSILPRFIKIFKEHDPRLSIFALDIFVYGKSPLACKLSDSIMLSFSGNNTLTYSVEFDNKRAPKIDEESNKVVIHRYYVSIPNNSRTLSDITAADSLSIELYSMDCESTKITIPSSTFSEWKHLIETSTATDRQ